MQHQTKDDLRKLSLKHQDCCDCVDYLDKYSHRIQEMDYKYHHREGCIICGEKGYKLDSNSVCYECRVKYPVKGVSE